MEGRPPNRVVVMRVSYGVTGSKVSLMSEDRCCRRSRDPLIAAAVAITAAISVKPDGGWSRRGSGFTSLFLKRR